MLALALISAWISFSRFAMLYAGLLSCSLEFGSAAGLKVVVQESTCTVRKIAILIVTTVFPVILPVYSLQVSIVFVIKHHRITIIPELVAVNCSLSVAVQKQNETERTSFVLICIFIFNRLLFAII